MGLAGNLGKAAAVYDQRKLQVGVVHNGTFTSERGLYHVFAELEELLVSMSVQI